MLLAVAEPRRGALALVAGDEAVARPLGYPDGIIPPVRVEHVSKAIRGRTVLASVDFELREGEVTVLLGPNGAGKTTLLRIMIGLVEPDSGRVELQGMDPFSNGAGTRAKVGYLPENGGLYGRMTAIDYLKFFGQAFGLSSDRAQSRAQSLLHAMGLEERAYSRTGTFSKGMQQRLALARTLIHDPPVLLLDEPTSSLDPESAVEVRALIGNLKGKGRTVLISTHNLDEADRIADRVLILAAGVLIVQARRDELYTANVVTLLSVQTSAEAAAALSSSPLRCAEILRVQGDRVEMSVPGGRSAIPSVVLELTGRRIPIYQMSEQRESLEVVYLRALESAKQQASIEGDERSRGRSRAI
jgi:ABC-2 type transport system ATP-binding protein